MCYRPYATVASARVSGVKAGGRRWVAKSRDRKAGPAANGSNAPSYRIWHSNKNSCPFSTCRRTYRHLDVSYDALRKVEQQQQQQRLDGCINFNDEKRPTSGADISRLLMLLRSVLANRSDRTYTRHTRAVQRGRDCNEPTQGRMRTRRRLGATI